MDDNRDPLDDFETPEELTSPMGNLDGTTAGLGRTAKRHTLLHIAVILVIILGLSLGTYFGASKISSSKNTKSVVSSQEKPAANEEPSALPPTATQKAVAVPDAVRPVNPESIPLGDGKVGKSPQVGYINSCQTSFNKNAGGAQVAGPWINASAKTWSSVTKTKVSGDISWPAAVYKVTLSGDKRYISGNNLPINHTTGQFPVSSSDTAYKYDRNPNKITAKSIAWTLPANPTAASSPSCLPMGEIGIISDGVAFFNGLDGEGRDAAAYETLDSCDGHPERSSEYHHHSVPSCTLEKTTGANSSTLVGYATDGYGIYVERDAKGNMLTNDNLDVCHGRTSQVMWDGTYISMYHYTATIEYPYTVGCFHGTSAVKQSGP